MDPEERGKQIGEEGTKLLFRFFAARPGSANTQSLMTALKERSEKRDPNVIRTEQKSGEYLYSLRFTERQFEKLKSTYLKYRPEARVPNIKKYDVDWLDDAACVFVGTIERWAAELYFDQGNMPAIQKERKRSMKSVNLALYKLEETLGELDTDALAYWYGHVVDTLAKAGYQVSESDNQLVSMLRAPVTATVESLELRNSLSTVIKEIVNATTIAADTLPKFNRTEYDPRYKIARHLERFVIENNMHFDSTDDGFSSTCLTEMFSLAGFEDDTVTYWLKKAEDNEDSHARWLQRMRNNA